MFTIYYANQLDIQKDILIHLMEKDPLEDPLQAETILVQSPGMAQWLQWQIADKTGIASNLSFPMPATFIWQQYVDNLLNADQRNEFDKDGILWRLMRLIPQYLHLDSFLPLRRYLAHSTQKEQQKQYLLACKIADLFDQYLVYRPDWIMAWEQHQDHKILQQLQQNNAQLMPQLTQHINWQGILWRALIQEIQDEQPNQPILHRASLHHQFLQKLQTGKIKHLPKRIFIFGISALPKTYLDMLYAMSSYCDIHLFFNNGCQEYWGDIVDTRYLENWRLRYRTSFLKDEKVRWISDEKLKQSEQEVTHTYHQEILQVGNPLLASWGKLGRDFLYLLTNLEANEIVSYVESSNQHLLGQLQNQILHLTPTKTEPLFYDEQDRSISFHACYSAMREVEVLHDYLLHLFNQAPELTPKDIVVMVADIDQYTPYIRAVFGKKTHFENAPFLPFSISDNKLSENNVLVSSFLELLRLQECLFSAEEILALLDVPAIRQKFEIELDDLAHIRHWVEHSGIRFGLEKQSSEQQEKNYNSWQAGLERMLLGYAMREENGIWQDSLGFDNTYGLKGKLAGQLAEFIDCLYQWQQALQQNDTIEQWEKKLTTLIDDIFIDNTETRETLWYLKDCIQILSEQIRHTQFNLPLSSEVIIEELNSRLQENPNSLRFLAGKINFCTLLPMRSIPFKVVCLLGMNEGQYPRQYTPNSFDLIQYSPQKGDRVRRDDDRYLFLEALLSAQKYFYVSYIGRSIIDDSKREPSVLVSQLLDYLTENLAQDEDAQTQEMWKRKLVQEHSMTAFSAQNFKGNHRTFAKQWLPLAEKKNVHPIQDFIQPISSTENVSEIELTQLIAFVQNPVKFFFEKRLGVYFSQKGDTIAENENFELNALDTYKINEQLILCDPVETHEFFERLRLKGVMPRGQFAQIYQQKLEDNLQSLKEKIQPYLSQKPISKSVELIFQTHLGEVKLQGYLNDLYEIAEQKIQRVNWRVGNVRDKDRIENWIYALVQSATQSQSTTAIFHARDCTEQYPMLEKSTALQQLQIYIEDYLAGQQKMQLVLHNELVNYFNALNKLQAEESPAPQAESQLTQDYLEKATQNDDYWQRLLSQTTWDETQLTELAQRTRNWFAKMLSLISMEKNKA